MSGGNRDTGFGQIKLGFNEKQINASGRQAADLPSENLKKLFGRQVPKRADKMSRRPHIPRNEKFSSNPGRCFSCCDSGILCHTSVKELNFNIGRKFAGIAAEGGSQKNIRPRFSIGHMHGTHDIGARQAELRRICAGGHAKRLKHGAGGSVDKQGTAKAE